MRGISERDVEESRTRGQQEWTPAANQGWCVPFWVEHGALGLSVPVSPTFDVEIYWKLTFRLSKYLRERSVKRRQGEHDYVHLEQIEHLLLCHESEHLGLYLPLDIEPPQR